MNPNPQSAPVSNEESVWNRVRLCGPGDHLVLAELYKKSVPNTAFTITPGLIATTTDAVLARTGKDGAIEMFLWCTRGGCPGVYADPSFASSDRAVPAFLDLIRAAREFYPPQCWPELLVTFPAELKGLEQNLKQFGFLADDKVHTCAVAEKVFSESSQVN